jgi:hypothetical protein
MKYRIVEKAETHGKPYFIPQRKPKLCPIYLSWKTTHTGHDWSTVCYETKNEANEHIKQHKEHRYNGRKPYSKIHNL